MPAARPVFLPKMGAFLVELREARGWKQAQAADLAKRRGLSLGYQAFRWLEEGKIKSPEPELLRAVAELYDLPYETLVAFASAERYGLQSDLLRHAGDQRSGSHQGGPADDPASARIVELERELSDYRNRFGEVQDVARKLFRIAIGSEEGRSAPSGKTGGSRARGNRNR